MTKKRTSLVFFGSGPVALRSLELLKKNFDVEAVVTKPTTIQDMASIVSEEIIHSASNKKELDDLFTTLNLKSKVGVLVDFGIIVSKKIIDFFPKGIVNSHFSLLPELRGADPISFAILEGKKATGVSLMLLVEAMDEGPIIATENLILDDTKDSIEITEELIQLSNSLLNKYLGAYVEGEKISESDVYIKPINQKDLMQSLSKDFAPTYTRKLKKSDGLLDFSKPANQLSREIRAFIEWPKSKTTLTGGIEVIITKARSINNDVEYRTPGKIMIDIDRILIDTFKGQLEILELKPVGKKTMDVKSFLLGYRSRLD